MASWVSPAALPSRFLERDDARQAITDHDFGTVFALARKYAGISFQKIADACEIKPERVGALARGVGRITSHAKFEQIADGLRIPGAMMGLAPRDWERVHGPTQALSGGSEADLWEAMELVRRTEQTDVGPAAIDAIAASVDRLCRAYPYMSAPELHRQARQGLRFVTGLLEGRTTLRQHRELLVAVGWLFLLSGCLEYDMGHRRMAEVSRAAALNVGIEAGHGEIAAWSWEMEAWFALTQGRYSDVLAAVEAGHRADASHSVGVQLCAQEAKAYGRLGDGRMVRSTLDLGRARLDRMPRPEHPEHHFVIDPDKWDFYEMDAYRLLRDDDRAALHAREVLRLGSGPNGVERSPMRMAEARLTLGVTAARGGELEEAVTVGSAAFRTARQSLPSLLLVAGELNEVLQERYPKETRARDYWHDYVTLANAERPELEGRP
ncbi:hypothetical protein [Embleya scabrispora]|uniref:hypothetical protein n=1 Tax=Embleya scabrispora TaxID=159449 RepID=UPI00047635F8|nr:hypothetical protein [Embleya scabrispora]MYS79854.1 tetratricopeptide repeat protein [Streptomyces sp. SID5474]